jgi:flagellin
MSTYINTNTTAYNASLALSLNNANESNDIEQLSTGLRINSAADDPAGLVVSESNQAQLSGLNAATANSNDAINETSTAESALNQVQNLLISIRSLAVDASNAGADNSTAIQADQTQIASAIASINRIAATTQYGTKYLLNGSANSGLTATAGSAVASQGAQFNIVSQGSWSTGNAYNFTTNSLSANSYATDTIATTTVAGGTPAVLTAANATFAGSLAINGTTYTLGSTTTANNLGALNTAIASSRNTASFNGTGNLVFTANTTGPVPSATVNTSGLTISGAVSSIAATGTAAAHVVTFATAAGTGGTLPTAATVTATTPVSVSGTLAITSASGTTFSQTFNPGTSLYTVQQALNSTFGTGTDAVTAAITAGGAITFTDASNALTTQTTNFAAYNEATVPSTATFTNGTNATLTLGNGTAADNLVSQETEVINGVEYYTFNNGLVLSSTTAPVTTGTTTLNGSLSATAGTSSTGTSLEYQLGANGGQNASLAIQSFASSQLGQGAANYVDANGNTQTVLTGNVANINVTTFKGAQDAIAVIDQAISQVSTARANLGAFQTNVLQSNVTSLGVATSNLQSSEATVADADVAQTVVNYTKDQILTAASTSALSYSNQQPQEILKLLQ